jgi:Holliday junction resolvasome RuvABC endonuclease subunit
MIILGADISSVNSGWCVIDAGKIVETGEINPVTRLQPAYGTKAKTKESIDQQDILKVIANDLSVIISRLNVDFFVIEDCFLKANPKTHQLLSRLSGAALWEWLRDGRVKALIIAPSSARRLVGFYSKNKGAVLKADLVKFVNYRWNAGVTSHDRADAIVLAMAGWEKVKANV